MNGQTFLKSKFKIPIEGTRRIWVENTPSIDETIENLDFIFSCVEKGLIKIKPKDSGKAVETDHDGVFKLPEVGQKKKRGRPTKQSAPNAATRARSKSSGSSSLDDSVPPNRSSKSRRAAAQAAGQKLAQVQSFMKATKLRRPTDYDEKQSKSRKTRQNQSASSDDSSKEEDSLVESGNVRIGEEVVNGYAVKVCEVVLERLNSPTIRYFTQNRGNNSSTSSSPRQGEDGPTETDNLVNGESVVNANKVQSCEVALKRINTPTAKSLTNNRGKSKSLERISRKRTSSELFNDSAPLLQYTDKCENKQPNLSRKIKQNENQVLNDSSKNEVEHQTKRFKSSTSSNESQEVIPVAQSSPNVCESPVTNEAFNGFDFELDKNPTVQCNTFVKHELDDDVFENVGSQTVEKHEQILTATETKTTKCSIKVLKKFENNLKTEEKENVNRNNEIITISEELIESGVETSNTKSRTRVLRKKDETEVKNSEQVDGNKGSKNQTNTAVQHQDKSPIVHSSTRITKKADNDTTQAKSDVNDIVDLVDDNGPDVISRSRTKTLRKKDVDSPEEESNVRSRTKTLKKAVQPLSVYENNAKYLASECKEPLGDISKQDKRLLQEAPPRSPAPKGELVKKRVEDFEKMRNGEEVDEENPSRVTRNAAKNKAAPGSKVTRNVLFNKLMGSASKQQITPTFTTKVAAGLESASRFQVVNKFSHATDRTTPVENNEAVVHKQLVHKAGKRKKEEDHIKRQAKEEDAKKKKEKTLKATAEETRRKREEKLQKVAAAREAADREKALLAAKLEKEKEDKMRLIAAEKEKLKEEQLKKKLLMQQKTLENEERRRQEEAARLAKIKEQEEEHRRLLAMKEREQELNQKHQKAAELRLTEAEKAKQQGKSKLGKLAAVNNAKMKLQLGMTPSDKTKTPDVVQSQSYELTPAREDRPLLKPKTDDDYGLDDAHSDDSSDEESCPKKEIPQWAQPKNRERLIKITRHIPSALWTQFMVPNVNPDLSKMFAGTQIKKRVRTSSAVWRTPPRYSHFPK